MPNISQPQVAAAIKALISPVTDAGMVLDRERYCESESEYYKLFVSLSSDGKAHGWLINYVGFLQRRADGNCEITRTLVYQLEVLYPYDDKPSGEPSKTSHEKFREMVEAVNDVFNQEANWDLGLGNQVRHNLLQAEADFDIKKFGKGTDARKSHIATFRLEVEVINSY